jgi:hypothetical protein
MAKKKKKRKSSYNKSASKGGGFERQMCRAWSLWWTGDKRDDIFWRTSGSGSRATTRAKRGKADKWNHGDMRPDDPEGFLLCANWCFEFKFYQKYDIKGVLHHVADNGNWLEWWAKIYREAEDIHRIPFLVTKQNAGVPVIWIIHDVWIRLSCYFPRKIPVICQTIPKQKVKVRLKNKKKKTMTVQLPDHKVHGIRLSEFFEFIEPDMLQRFILREDHEQ